MRLSYLAFAAPLAIVATAPAQAVVGYADVVLDYYNSGAGTYTTAYGGTAANFPVLVSTSVVLGPDPLGDFLSLPTGSYVTVGFTDETVFDGVGNDIFIGEVGASGEKAEVYVSSDNVNFTFLGIAIDNVTTAFDLSTISYTGQVTAVKIVGLDSLGGSPGFDVSFVQGPAGLGQGRAGARELGDDDRRLRPAGRCAPAPRDAPALRLNPGCGGAAFLRPSRRGQARRACFPVGISLGRA